MSPIIYSALNSSQTYSGQTGENPPYKGGWWKIGYHQEGGISQNSPNPGLALRWSHPCSLPIEWGSRGCPECQPSTTSGTKHPGLAAGKGRRWEKLPSSSGIMINSRGERMTKALEGTKELQQTPSTIKPEKPEETDLVDTNSHMQSVEFSHVIL